MGTIYKQFWLSVIFWVFWINVWINTMKGYNFFYDNESYILSGFIINLLLIYLFWGFFRDQEHKRTVLIEKYGNMEPVRIALLNEINELDKLQLLTSIHGYSVKKALHLVRGAANEIFINTYRKMPAEEIALSQELLFVEKQNLLTEVYGYSLDEAIELINSARKEEKRTKLKGIKRKIAQKADEQYNNLPITDRQPISEDVKTVVWRRDQGRCVKCGSNERLEFDHIIPFIKGGSNTERNIQLLCEHCNRSKSDNI